MCSDVHVGETEAENRFIRQYARSAWWQCIRPLTPALSLWEGAQGTRVGIVSAPKRRMRPLTARAPGRPRPHQAKAGPQQEEEA